MAVCNLCNSDNSRLLGRDIDDIVREIHSCAECGLVFAFPPPSLKTLRSFYQQLYSNCGGQSGLHKDEGPSTEFDAILQEGTKRRVSFIERFREKGKILDIGSS